MSPDQSELGDAVDTIKEEELTLPLQPSCQPTDGQPSEPNSRPQPSPLAGAGPGTSTAQTLANGPAAVPSASGLSEKGEEGCNTDDAVYPGFGSIDELASAVEHESARVLLFAMCKRLPRAATSRDLEYMVLLMMHVLSKIREWEGGGGTVSPEDRKLFGSVWGWLNGWLEEKLGETDWKWVCECLGKLKGEATGLDDDRQELLIAAFEQQVGVRGGRV